MLSLRTTLFSEDFANLVVALRCAMKMKTMEIISIANSKDWLSNFFSLVELHTDILRREGIELQNAPSSVFSASLSFEEESTFTTPQGRKEPSSVQKDLSKELDVGTEPPYIQRSRAASFLAMVYPCVIFQVPRLVFILF